MYVSQPKSSCDKGDIPDNLMNLEQWSHFHINRPLHPHNIASLCTLFPGGIEKLLWEQVGHKNVSSWEKMIKRTSDEWGNFKWSVPIHVTGWKFLNCVIPFHPRYEETEEWTPLCLHLYGTKKLYLKEGNNGRKGSFQRIRDEMYVLSRKQQNIMNEIETAKQEWAMDQKVILKAKLNEMKAKNDLIQKEKDILKEKNDQIQKEKDILKEENDLIQREKDILKSKKMTSLKIKENELNSKVQVVEFKDLSHLMILIPAKMNSPDYEDFIDMFSVPTPISPLPPTPIASPSHEASEDVIYDALPPMEQSTVFESPLKDPMEPSTVSESPLKEHGTIYRLESPLKEPIVSKSPMVSKSPDPPVKKAPVKRFIP
ncbi:uncharacterized protein TNCV_721781 [Trichonephila clavipes]|nr:uncharacterized protein TNCV_721781 [Trichonephila clavipes]